MRNWGVWLLGLIGASVTAFATVVTSIALTPEVLLQLGWRTVLTQAAAGAVIGAAAYLKQSPVPQGPLNTVRRFENRLVERGTGAGHQERH